MSEIFRIPSDRQPLDRDGRVFISRPWFLFLEGLFIRSGGATGTPISDFDFAIASDTADADQAHVFMRQIQALNLAPVVQSLEQQVMWLEGELSSTRDALAELRRTVEGMQAGTSI